SSFICSRENRRSAYGPRPSRSTASANAKVISQTRCECPEVVGSRCSIAFTAAFTNPSKRFSMSRYRREFSYATAACDESDSPSRTECSGKACTFLCTDFASCKRTFHDRLQFNNCSTPSTSPFPFFMGSASSDLVLYPACSSNDLLKWNGTPFGTRYASASSTTCPCQAQ